MFPSSREIGGSIANLTQQPATMPSERPVPTTRASHFQSHHRAPLRGSRPSALGLGPSKCGTLSERRLAQARALEFDQSGSCLLWGESVPSTSTIPQMISKQPAALVFGFK